MRLALFVICLLTAILSIKSAANEQALELYQQSLEKFESGNLREAERLAKQALELVNIDGSIKTNIRSLYDYKRLGRKYEMTSRTFGDDNPYAPNLLLNQISAQKQKILDVKKARAKRSSPPKLLVRHLSIIDEDGNDLLSALEHVTLRLTLVNVGKGKAESIKIILNDQELGLQNKHLYSEIASLSPNQEVAVEFTFSMPKKLVNTHSSLLLNVQELDGLGEIVNQNIVLATRPYFAPILSFKQIADTSLGIPANKRTTRHIKITNTGKETAFDVALKLNFAYSNKVRVLHDLDIDFIPYLPAGASRTVSFTIEPTRHAKLADPLGVSISHSLRGREKSEYDLQLFLANKSVRQTKPSQQFLSQLSNFKLTSKVEDKTNSAALIIDLSPNTDGAQFNNVTFMQDFFSQSAGLPSDRIIMVTQKLFSNKSNGTQHLNTALLKTKMQSISPSLLMVYVNATGHFNFKTQQASLNLGATNQVSMLPLQQLLITLRAITDAPVAVFIETDLKKKSDTTATPLLYIEQKLIPKLPAQMQLAVATQAGQSHLAFNDKAMGIFTFALTETLTQMLDSRPLSMATVSQAMPQIQKRTTDISLNLHGYQQIPNLTMHP